MRSRLLPALAGLTALTLTGLVLPADTASAKADACQTSIDPASIVVKPTTVAVGVKGSKKLEVTMRFSAPCGKADGSDLEAVTFFGLPDPKDSYPLDASDIIEAHGDHVYGFDGAHTISTEDLRNHDAGTWTTEFQVADLDDRPDENFDSLFGPTLRVLRATKATASAPATAKKGKKVTVKGKLTRANWSTDKDGAFAKVPVTLQFKAKNGSYADVKTVKSSSAGTLSATVAATVDGSYRFVYAGNSTSAAATSKADVVDVR